MGYQPYAGAPAPAGMEPPEAQSVRSMLHIVRILAVIFGILLFIGGLVYVAAVYAAYAACTATVGLYCGGALGALLIFPFLVVIWGVVDVVIYLKMKEIEGLVNQHQYESAKSKTLVWMIIGFIIGGIILGILLLVAYLKFDPLISWQRNQDVGRGRLRGRPGRPSGSGDGCRARGGRPEVLLFVRVAERAGRNVLCEVRRPDGPLRARTVRARTPSLALRLAVGAPSGSFPLPRCRAGRVDLPRTVAGRSRSCR